MSQFSWLWVTHKSGMIAWPSRHYDRRTILGQPANRGLVSSLYSLFWWHAAVCAHFRSGLGRLYNVFTVDCLISSRIFLLDAWFCQQNYWQPMLLTNDVFDKRWCWETVLLETEASVTLIEFLAQWEDIYKTQVPRLSGSCISYQVFS